MSQQPAPKEVRILPDGIFIQWSDGHQSNYGHRYLRYHCGCAACVSENTGQRMIALADVRSDVTALDWMPVGRYALQFLWSDTHTTGIYPFTTLRALCQCNICQQSRTKSDG